MDTIKLTGLTIRANHGVYDFEKEKGQKFVLDIVLYTDNQSAGVSDELNETVNYAELATYAQEVFTTTTFNLIEAACENLATAILKRYERINMVQVTVNKPEAPIEVPFENVSVSITRKWHKAFLSIGSNIGDSKEIIEGAGKAFENNRFIRNLKSASYYETKPYGYEDQPDFLNTCWEIETTLNPMSLLALCNKTEADYKRERTIHWGPRTLDIDIVYYDNLVIENEKLTIPHRDMHNRAFVLEPLCELAPDMKHPVIGKTNKEMLEDIR